MIDMRMTGRQIKRLRIMSELTQSELANLLGVTPQTISNWENALTYISITNLERLSEIFMVKIEDILISHNI